MQNKIELIAFNRLIDAGNPVETLRTIAASFPGEVVFSTSFSWEDQAITHLIVSNHISIDIFTLDTGRLFPETYSTWTATLEKYKVPIHAYYPEAGSLQHFVSANGPNAFNSSIENRKACCGIRKVEPLTRALINKKVWVTGIRSAHSVNRQQMNQIEYDEQHSVFKYHPLLYWTTEELQAYIKTNKIPINPLQDKGFVSIGCAPCTRAIAPGEDFRAGRWWWEAADKKECGLHTHS